MKFRNLVIFLILILNSSLNIFAQTNYIKDAVLNEPIPAQRRSGTLQKVATTTEIIDIVILAVDAGASQTIPGWFYDLMSYADDFMRTSTFDNYSLDIELLEESTGQAFEMPNSYTPIFDASCSSPTDENGHVHRYSNIIDVLTQADAIYDFNDYDYDANGIVPIHFVSIGPGSGGIICNIWFTTSDLDGSGNPIRIVVNRQSRGSGDAVLRNVYTHEFGHGEFNFPDMDHSGATDLNHYGIGGFDVMCSLGFNGEPSPYSPFLRAVRGWVTPTSITSNNANFVLEEFQKNQKVYVYEPSTQPSNGYGTQRFYISYHDDDDINNSFYVRYPYADESVGGVLVWHTTTTSLSTGTSFSDWKRLPIDIESAHGKTIWTETATDVIDTDVENPLTGRDKLEIRKISSGHEIAGPYFGVDRGDGTIFYTPGYGQKFSFSTNPNSNFIVNSSTESYAQSIVTGFSIENILIESSTVKASVKVDNLVIEENTTLTEGTWYINGSVTVSSGVTLTIPGGTELYFASGTQLIVHGRIVAEDATFQPVSGGAWKGITIDGSSMSSFDNCRITGCTYDYNSYGLILGGSNGVAHEVYDCYIEGSAAAVWIKSDSDPIINNSYLKATGSGNVVLSTDNSDGKINNCKLYSSGSNVVHGHANMNSATPSYDYPADGLNLIDGSNFTSAGSGIYVSGGYPNFDDGYNTIPSRQMLYQYSNYSGSSKSAENNYWGGGAPAVEGTVDYSPYLATPHANVGPDWTLSKKSSDNEAVNENNPLADAWKEYFNKNFTKSKEMAKELFQSRNTEEQSCEILFLWMKSAMREGTLKEEENNLLSLNKNYSINELARYESLRWLSKLAVRNGDFQKAENYASSIPSKSLMGREILFDVSSEIMENWGDIDRASAMLDKVTEKYTDTETLKEKQFVLGLYTNNAKAYSSPNKEEPRFTVSKDNTLNLSEAYPNPFNPTTKISFTIPSSGYVSLKVYDILGREVFVLANKVFEAGKYEVEFDASNLPSGVYISSLTYGNKTLTQKMLLLK